VLYPSVFQPTHPPLNQGLNGLPATLLWLSPLQGATRSARWLLASRCNDQQDHQRLSWSFFPLRRMSLSESTPLRFAKPDTFRPQGFSPSRRVTPRPDVRPCFMPVAPMGFSALQGFTPATRSSRLVTTGLPSWRSPSFTQAISASEADRGD
jgi:hypothetical protein